VASLTVVEAFNVFLYRGRGIGAGRIALMVHLLIFQAAPELFIGALSYQFPQREMDGCIPNCFTSF